MHIGRRILGSSLSFLHVTDVRNLYDKFVCYLLPTCPNLSVIRLRKFTNLYILTFDIGEYATNHAMIFYLFLLQLMHGDLTQWAKKKHVGARHDMSSPKDCKMIYMLGFSFSIYILKVIFIPIK